MKGCLGASLTLLWVVVAKKVVVMLLPIKLICDRRTRKDGTNPICIQYCFRPDKRTLLNTEIYIPARYWNKKLARISKDMPATFGNAEVLNDKLGLLVRKAEDIISFSKRRNIEDILGFLKKTFHPSFDVASLETAVAEAALLNEKSDNKTNLDLYYQIDDYIKSKEKKVCRDMPRIYRNMKEHLKAFEEFRGEKITFESLDLKVAETHFYLFYLFKH